MKIGLVLGGGLARGAAQLGFLKTFFSRVNRNDVKIISASSIGVLSGLAFSYDKIDDLAKAYLDIHFDNRKALKLAIKGKFFFEIIGSVAKPDNVLEIPMYACCACMNNLTPHYYYFDKDTDLEEITKISDISCAFPLINGFMKNYQNRLYIDGGAFDNIPTYPLRYEDDLDFIIVLHSASNYEPPADLIESGIPLLNIHVTAGLHRKMGTFSLTRKHITEMWEYGLKMGEEVGERIVKAIEEGTLKETCQKIVNENVNAYKDSHTFLTSVELLNRLMASRVHRYHDQIKKPNSKNNEEQK